MEETSAIFMLFCIIHNHHFECSCENAVFSPHFIVFKLLLVIDNLTEVNMNITN